MKELEEILKTFPHLDKALGERTLACLSAPPTEPYGDDQGYLESVRALWDLRSKKRQTRLNMETSLLDIYRIDVDLERLEAIGEGLARALEHLEKLHAARLAATAAKGRPPLLERIARILGLSARELLAVQYMMLRNSGLKYDLDDSVRSLGEQAGFSTAELVAFLDPDRQHMKQGLLEVETRLSPSVLDGDFRMSDEWVKAIAGCRLSSDEFLKIDGTALSAVLVEDGLVPPPEPESGSPRRELPAGRGSGEDDPEGLEEEEGWAPEGAAGDGAPEAGEPDAGGEGGLPLREEGSGAGGEFDLHDFIKEEKAIEDGRQGLGSGEPAAEAQSALTPYSNDLEYLEDHFNRIATRIKIRKMELSRDSSFVSLRERSPESTLRELRALERVQERRCEARLQATRDAGGRLPRLERLAERRGLVDFEKVVLLTLIGTRISYEVQKALDSAGLYGLGEIKGLLDLWCSRLEERIARRRHFYKNSTLIREGMVRLDDMLSGDLEKCSIDIDRRMMDFLTGLDTESDEIVDGSHLYSPRVRMDQVVLPPDQKKLILETVSNYTAFSEVRKSLGFDDVISYGRSIVMLFFGPSGTGKTMMANALANHLGKKVLLINFPSLGGVHSGHVIRYIFREARINEAILFFDECESLFESRAFDNPDVTMLLTEMERHDGLVIMATNRPFELDEAMHRRITLALEFRQPDIHLREAIWRNHFPPALPLAADVDLKALALNFELSGGFIKNAVISALSIAVARDGRTPVIRMEDLEKGARLQLRSRLRLVDFDRRVVPAGGMDSFIGPPGLRKNLEEIVNFEKARNVLFGRWGFEETMAYGQGTAALFAGPPGTGKSHAAEALGYELGKPLKVVNCAELISKYVGDSAKNIDQLFREARDNDSILVFDEAEGLFGARTSMGSSTDRYANIDVGLLLYHIERFPGIVILTTNLPENIDPALFRRLKFVLEFPFPDKPLRAALWKALLPARAPLLPDVELETLAARFELAGGHIKNAVFKAAARAAMRDEENRRIGQQDLLDAAAEEERQLSGGTRLGFHAKGQGPKA